MPTNCFDRIILTPAQVRELASAPDELVSFTAFSQHVCTQTPPRKRPFLGLSGERGLC